MPFAEAYCCFYVAIIKSKKDSLVHIVPAILLYDFMEFCNKPQQSAQGLMFHP